MFELKPCPFCGGQADISVDPEATTDTEGRRWAYTVVCNRCCATSGLTYLPEKAIEAWNRRADVAPAVHARWVDDKCSNCGVDIPTDDARDAIFGSECHFCYYCGAKMDGGVDNEAD